MKPRCTKCGGLLLGDTDPWGTLTVKCLTCGWQRSRETSTLYNDLSILAVKESITPSKFLPKVRPKTKGKGKFVACRVVACPTLVELTSISRLCRGCWQRKSQWEQGAQTTPPPFLVHPEDEGLELPRLIWNPEKPRPGTGYGVRSRATGSGPRAADKTEVMKW